MTTQEFIDACKQIIYDYYKENIGEIPIECFEICSYKTLQNRKAILSTHYYDTRLFEITYNGDTNEIYMDCYVKESNRKV